MNSPITNNEGPNKFILTATGGNTAATMWVYIIGARGSGFSPANGIAGNHFRDNLAEDTRRATGTIAVRPRSGTFTSSCEVQFTVEPQILITDGNNNRFDKSQVQWFLDRDERVKGWIRGANRTVNDGWRQMPEEDWLPNAWGRDPSLLRFLDLDPWDSGHLYDNDEPGWPGVTEDGVVLKQNFRQWARVGLGGVRGRDGESCSEYYYWHAFRACTRQGNAYREDNTYENEIKRGNIFWGKTPIAGLEITTTSLPDGIRLALYGHALTKTGGVGDVIWTIDLGALPLGLSLDRDTGIISGLPLESGEFRFTVEAQDSATPDPDADLQSLKLIIVSPPP